MLKVKPQHRKQGYTDSMHSVKNILVRQNSTYIYIKHILIKLIILKLILLVNFSCSDP